MRWTSQQWRIFIMCFVVCLYVCLCVFVFVAAQPGMDVENRILFVEAKVGWEYVFSPIHVLFVLILVILIHVVVLHRLDRLYCLLVDTTVLLRWFFRSCCRHLSLR